MTHLNQSEQNIVGPRPIRVENTAGNWWGESRRRVLAYLKQQRKLNFVVLVKIFKFDWQNSKLDANMSSGVCDLLGQSQFSAVSITVETWLEQNWEDCLR